ncbi:hypothetical protein [Halorubellus sp. PRR65]|uniref:hypothetical protein n=1 Tax=Halorubellus sp. PRR65 TaxID=3098148 RepID=UPI002B256814|nr:hypothetical protein [Halorubellus sp. PRR65]
MTTAGRYEGWAYAPLRFAVWVLAAIYLGRIGYDNTLYDLGELTALRVVVRTVSIAITLAFVYWNLFIVPGQLRGIIWATVALLAGAVLVWKYIIETGVEYHDARDPLNRRRPHDSDIESLDLGRRVAGKRLGDTTDDD